MQVVKVFSAHCRGRRYYPERASAGCIEDVKPNSEWTADYVMLTSVYVPYTCRNASQISPTVA
jgi:hypothetical protein